MRDTHGFTGSIYFPPDCRRSVNWNLPTLFRPAAVSCVKDITYVLTAYICCRIKGAGTIMKQNETRNRLVESSVQFMNILKNARPVT